MNDSLKKRYSSPIKDYLGDNEQTSFLEFDTISTLNSFSSSPSSNRSPSLHKYARVSLNTSSLTSQMKFFKKFKKLIVHIFLISILFYLTHNYLKKSNRKVIKRLYLKDFDLLYKNENSGIVSRNLAIYDEFYQIKQAASQVYSSVQFPFEYCTDYQNLKGQIDVEKVLEDLNLTNLVNFYKTIKTNNMTYENSSMELGELWNSTDINLLNSTDDFMSRDLVDYENIEQGGHWKPKQCKSRFKVAIIIPFRDRLPHLKVITNYLHMFLQRQMLDYRIFVVEPTIPLNISFNKGRVMNSAYLEVLKVDPKIDCIIFHDVDLIPEDDRNIYTCSSRPRHLSVAIDKFDYVLPYSYLVGGVLSIRTDQYKLTNGYSNSYWGWGGEDDDFSVRIKKANLILQRPPTKIARYRMMKHKPQTLNKDRFKLLRRTSKVIKNDGLTTVKYTVIDYTKFKLFTYILIDVGNP
ncbi:unnamed protein product [Brachionus calyciflorus]|uniref:Beta-1,4-galactosyltransferase n=1 Tax=Brachionus calyciflorus TaxID=104777 RepID=A0A813ZP04_9BILA|nr:unnamed protein product [Brachionus calyciflorus]